MRGIGSTTLRKALVKRITVLEARIKVLEGERKETLNLLDTEKRYATKMVDEALKISAENKVNLKRAEAAEGRPGPMHNACTSHAQAMRQGRTGPRWRTDQNSMPSCAFTPAAK